MRNAFVFIKKVLYVIFFIGSLNAFSQSDAVLGETAVNLIHPFSEKYSVDFTFRSRYFLFRSRTWQYNQQQVDLYHFSNYIINKKNIVSLGVYYRNRDLFDTGLGEIRITEKYNHITHYQHIRLRHKIRIEQRFLENTTVFRQRYMFEIGLPLKGETFDVGETYFTGSLEGLLSLSPHISTRTSLRTNALIAWKIAKTFKVKAGLEYRLNAFNQNTFSRLFLLTSAVILL
ncbi:DUF2490 domain-containing protein [Tamlana agarivorans]|uniref:DUF2490 domain-containing protein n=1 Tax=Pseudotamlana agarivorans TaxID=481183 RepID=A0ACC5U8Q6_9FLAO|nr:DUF2490 domain-containing protein [Tamlana agarivorans]MBU2950712.1 DUF2490 domain-containing protein [Tamlana agarivorans]